MSRENVELVRQGFEAWDRGDLAGVIRTFHEDAVIRPIIGPEWHGPEGFLGMAADWVEDFAEHTVQAEDFVDAGEAVVVRVRQEGRGVESGAPIEAVYWFVYTLRKRKAVRLELYRTEAEALEAVGLSEEAPRSRGES